MAAGLTEAGITDKIVIIDQSSADLNPDSFKYKAGRVPDIRAVSLTPGSMKFLDAIGVTPHLNKRLLTHVNEMQIWENQGSSSVNFKSNEVKSVIDFVKSNILNSSKSNETVEEDPSHPKYESMSKFISCMVEINHLTMALQSKIKHNNITRVSAKLDIDSFNIEQSEDYSYFTIYGSNQNTTYRTKLLLISDGPKSIARTKLNLPVTGYDYNETGLVCSLGCDKNTKTAYQRFTHNGIFALLPMYDNFYSIVCSMPTEYNEQLKQLKEEEFINFVNNLLHSPSEVDFSQLDRVLNHNSNNFNTPPFVVSLHSKRLSFPLQLQLVDNCIHKNCVIIGDSAHQIHPMAGQGLNLGIADCALLVNGLAKAKKLGKRLNDPEILSEYGTKTTINTKSMVTSMEAVKMMFRPTNSLFSGLRNYGMGILNNSEYLKGLMVDVASGKIILPDKYEWEKL
eukprot:CAMPEP_0170519080 /NCGR_PEP_ID=MMETSP0209-20121228/4617_1 /TAXON_ID=665100 ORGANISM="Litonotus pictus, Strain P1" /NCGR_SAMPLE_ID=MMETSP0209 /ASSEMBLY_ACC=CAM_ASM_000301 /LENGTH=452 /DNA_ID=CAMNT_0010804873 /DNA_START=273 /DNA_END=1631 /DNA_ORIENTATION=+